MPMIEVKDPQEFLSGGAEPVRPSEQFSTNYPGNPEEAPDLGAAALRYGVPAVAAMTPMGAGALALTTAASELGAQQVEGGIHTPTTMDLFQSALSGGASLLGSKVIAPAVDILGNKIANVGSRVMNYLLVPKDFFSSKETLPARNLYEVLKSMGSSPTPAQVVDTDLTNFIEGISRGAMFGKNVVTKLDEKNMSLLTDYTLDWINGHARLGFEPNPFDSNGLLRDLSKVRFGQIAEGVLTGKLNMARVINARNYNNFRESVAGANLEVEAAPVFDIITKNKDNPFMQNVEGRIRQWLQPVQELTTDPATGEMLPTNTTRLTVENAVEVMRQLNSFYGKAKGDKWAANQIKTALEPELKSSLKSAPDALDAYNYAQKTFSGFAENLDNKLLRGIRTKFNDFPSTALQTLDGAADRKFDVLQAIKKAYSTSAEGTPTGSLVAYQRNIVEPLRYHTLQQSMDTQTGALIGKDLIKNLDKMGDDMGKEIFGGEAGLKAMKDLGYAAQRIAESQSLGGRTLYIRMAQGSAIAGLGWWGWSTDNTAAKVGSTALFVAPPILSRYVIANPGLTRAVIDGMTTSVGSKAFNRAVSQLMALSGKDVTFLTEGLKDIYSNDQAHQTVSPQTGGWRSVEQSLQFVPEDTVEKNLLSRAQQEGAMPMP